MNKKIIQTILTFITLLSISTATAVSKVEMQIEPGIYVFVSFSLPDESLRNYFIDANRYGAKLVMRGLTGDKNSRNRFAITKARMERARINVDINPNLIEQLNITQIPVIAVVTSDQVIKKISGQISVQKALQLMDINISAGQKRAR